ncbi:MAG: diphosphate--fructose-6-phosphate 1-phosphotransferase [Chloroflexota bacterium]|nr:MAG: diphosphate--fructose-6-phosphate 1-phosphotransferase [Chloroflexota bacterium]
MTANLIIGQSGGGTAVINSSLVGAVREAQRHSEIGRVFGMLNGVEGLLGDQVIDLTAQNDMVLDRLLTTPSSALGSCRFKVGGSDLDQLLTSLRRRDIRYVLYIGGNDSAESAHQLALAATRAGHELQVVAAPKTIDNDLPETDHCPGYGSAARFLAIVTMEMDLDAWAMRSVEPVRFLEVKGRNSGWLAAACALGRATEAMAPHLVCIPERPFVEEDFLVALDNCYRRHGYAVVIMPETQRDAHGKLLGSHGSAWRDQYGHEYSLGTEGYLIDLVSRHLGVRARYDRPGFLHKTSLLHVSDVDRREAYLVGQEAVCAALRGESDVMVILRRTSNEPYSCDVATIELPRIAGGERYLPDNYVSLDGTSIDPDFINYLRPLVGGNLPTFAHLR